MAKKITLAVGTEPKYTLGVLYQPIGGGLFRGEIYIRAPKRAEVEALANSVQAALGPRSRTDDIHVGKPKDFAAGAWLASGVVSFSEADRRQVDSVLRKATHWLRIRQSDNPLSRGRELSGLTYLNVPTLEMWEQAAVEAGHDHRSADHWYMGRFAPPPLVRERANALRVAENERRVAALK